MAYMISNVTGSLLHLIQNKSLGKRPRESIMQDKKYKVNVMKMLLILLIYDYTFEIWDGRITMSLLKP